MAPVITLLLVLWHQSFTLCNSALVGGGNHGKVWRHPQSVNGVSRGMKLFSSTTSPTADPVAEGLDAFSSVVKYAARGVLGVGKVTAEETVREIIGLCDEIDKKNSSIGTTSSLLKDFSLRYGRYVLLQSLMADDYSSYVEVASFLSPGRIPRRELPNLQDVPTPMAGIQPTEFSTQDGDLVADCTLPPMPFSYGLLDSILLSRFRYLVEQNSNGIAYSNKAGLEGLLEQGRRFMLQPQQTPEAQHKMVRDTLAGLMTPVIVNVYRFFMAGIVPQWMMQRYQSLVNGVEYNENNGETKERQLGPLFYAPYLTSIVTPVFFGFLVGPSRPNSRKDGQPGGLVVEKCQFLQESGCKGLCLHQCKLPAQQFFADTLGVPLTVVPNFATQECQWSFGEVPLPPEEDPYFPKGCLVGCESRKAIVELGLKADCN